jgi:hypothetical protein
MRKDIQAINEAYFKATSTFNENVAQKSLADLQRIYKGSLRDVVVDTFLNEDDYPNNPTSVIYLFSYEPATRGDYDTPPTGEEIDFLGAFLDDATVAPVEVAEEDVDQARAKLIEEIDVESEPDEY